MNWCRRRDDSKCIKIKSKNFINFCSNPESIRTISKQFNDIMNTKKPENAQEFQKLPNKNRYPDITPYAFNRVILPPSKYCVSDYINASYINGPRHQKYIVTQDPLSTTVYDFWHMIMTSKCRAIIMLTEQCTQTSVKYYPNYNVEFRIGDISVFNIRQNNYRNFRKRLLTVTRDDGHTRLVVHYHFHVWPNPNEISNRVCDLIEFMRVIRNECEPFQTMVVQSTSGIGRTGVYIALDIVFDEMKRKKYINIFKTVAKLRQQRSGMVLTVDQYRIIFKVIDTYLMHTVRYFK